MINLVQLNKCMTAFSFRLHSVVDLVNSPLWDQVHKSPPLVQLPYAALTMPPASMKATFWSDMGTMNSK